MARLAVDPAVLVGAGVGLLGVGEGLGPAVAALSAGYSANTGQDTAGVMFGRHYADAGEGLMKAVAAGINALLRTGYGIQVSAVNYSRAEAYSDLSRRAQPLASPPCPVDVVAAGGPSALGGGVGEPSLWAVVELLVGDLWPSGSPAQMRIAAGAWRGFASVLHGISFEVSGPYNTVAAQEIPEGASIESVIRDIDTAFGRMARGCEELAAAVEGFATGVENTQNAIRRLLAKLGSIGSIVGIFFEFVRGWGEQDLEQVAADIRTVMAHLKNEADARKAEIEQALRDFDALNSAMQIVADREFTEFFGEDVGNVLSEVWRAGGDIDRGIARWTASTVEGLEALDPTRFFYDTDGALQTWKGLEQMAQVVTNPSADPELTKEIVKGLVRVDEWKTQRPLTALTENALDVGTLFLGPEAAAGGASKVGEFGDIAKIARGVDETTLTGALGKLTDVTRPVGALDEITTHTGQLTQELETAAVPPAGGKSVGGPMVDKPAGTPVLDKPGSVPVADKPTAAPIGDAKTVGGKPVSPVNPSGLPASPVESRAGAAAPEAPEVVEAPKASVSVAAGPPHGESSPPVGGQPGGRPDVGQGPSLGEVPDSSGADPTVPAPDSGGSGRSPVEGVDYGFSPTNAYDLLRNPADDIARLRDAGVPEHILEGYDPLAGRTFEEFHQDFTIVDDKGNMRWDWAGQAPNDGFARTPEVVDRIPEGLGLDRFGSDQGAFMAEDGATLSSRGMPPGVASRYSQFVGTGIPVPEGLPWEVRYGPAKEAFGQPGGAEQWVVFDVSDPQQSITVNVEQLLETGMVVPR